MFIPEEMPIGEDSFLRFLMFYDNEVLIQITSAPFWINTLISCLGLIGPETDPLLERIIHRVLERSTVDHYREIYPAIKADIELAWGPIPGIGFSPIERKYQVIISLLDALSSDPFDKYYWAVTLCSYTMDAFGLNDFARAELENRVRVALQNYEPTGT